MRFQSILTILAFILGMGALPPTVRAGNQPTRLSAANIVHQSAQRYASLASYRDQGTVASTLGKIVTASYSFTIKLARTNRYQICWWQPEHTQVPKGVVWSAGHGNYLWLKNSSRPRKTRNRETDLAMAAGISGGVVATIPETFFHARWGNQLGVAAMRSRRLPDGSVGNIDCYVVAYGNRGHTNTLWIGKRDLLIHQIERFTSAARVKKTMEEQAKTNPHVRALLQETNPQLFQDSRTIEIHRSIQSNPGLTNLDFEFHPPARKPSQAKQKSK